MNFRMCQTDHNPPHSYGDCVRASMATLLDDDNFPHVFDEREPEESWRIIREYLATKGKKLAVFQIEDIATMAEDCPDIPYMLCCSTIIGGHAVVGMNGKVIHDPAYAKREIRKYEGTDSWIVFIVV